MHDGMPYDPIQGQGDETFKVRNSSIFKIYLLRHFLMWAGKWPLILKLRNNIRQVAAAFRGGDRSPKRG